MKFTAPKCVSIASIVAALAGIGCTSRASPDSGSVDSDVVATPEQDVGPIECGTQLCVPGERCVDRVNYGSHIARDSGSCPDGTVPDPTFDSCIIRVESLECSTDPVRCGDLVCDGRDASFADGCSCGLTGATVWCTCSAY